MTLLNVLASLPVRDLAAAEPWYARILGRPADTHPMSEVAEWKFPGGGWLQVYQGPDRAGGGSCTLSVDNMDQTLADLRALGVDTGDQGKGDKTRTVMVKDPDGNSLAFAWTESAGMAK